MIFPAGTHATRYHPKAGVWEEKPQKERRSIKRKGKTFFAEKLEQALRAWGKK